MKEKYNLLEDILYNLEQRGFIFDKDKKFHLAIFTKDIIEKIKSGKKHYESRWSKFKHRPFGRILNGDIVIIKESKGPVVAFYIANDVSFEKNDVPELLYEKYISKTGFNISCYVEEKDKYITFMRMDDITFFEPFRVLKKDCQTWVCLN